MHPVFIVEIYLIFISAFVGQIYDVSVYVYKTLYFNNGILPFYRFSAENYLYLF